MTEHQDTFLSPLRHRVLQVERRRYSVRLEEAYWSILEKLAAESGYRLAEIIDEVAEAAGRQASLTAALRLRCLAYLQAGRPVPMDRGTAAHRLAPGLALRRPVGRGRTDDSAARLTNSPKTD